MALVVSYTLQPVTVSDTSQIVFRPGPAVGDITAVGYFDVKDDNGLVREGGTVNVLLTGAAKTAFISWATSNLVNAFNAQRGL